MTSPTKTDAYTDKLVEMAEAAGFRIGKYNSGKLYAGDSDGIDITAELTAFRDAIIAELCVDVEPVAWLDTVIDWTATGQPITRRICIQAQCGDWALSYIESALRETATTVAALKLQRDALQARVDAVEKDAERLVWAMQRLNSEEFVAHVIQVGGTGDINDCRTFIDAALAAKGQAS